MSILNTLILQKTRKTGIFFPILRVELKSVSVVIIREDDLTNNDNIQR